MQTWTQPFFSNQSRLLSEARIGAMARFYALPLPVFLPRDRGWHLLQSRGAVVETFWEKYCGIRGAGVGRLRACVTREAVTRTECAQADVTWFYIGQDGRRIGRTKVRYFLSRDAHGFRVDLMEFQCVAFPQLNDWFARNASQIVDTPPPH